MTQPATAEGSGAMFDAIAARYDTLNRILSLGLDRGWRRALVDALALPPGARVLDVATGTADVALAIARRHPDASVIGLDPSPAMLGVARRKLAEAGLTARVTLREGDAQALPFEEGSFDAVTIAFGIRNVPDRTRGLAEMARVLRPGGRLVVLELGEPRDGWLGVPVRFHIRQVVPRLGALLSGAREYRYLQRSVSAFPPPPQFAALLATAGLEAEPPRSLAFGAAHLYVAHKPGLTPEGSAPLSWRCPTAPPRNGS